MEDLALFVKRATDGIANLFLISRLLTVSR